MICLFPIIGFSQISVTSANGQNVKTLLETHFLGGGIEISNVPSYKREINTVFQRYSLFPHMNVFDNVGS